MTWFIVPPAPSPHSTNTCHSLLQHTRSTGGRPPVPLLPVPLHAVSLALSAPEPSLPRDCFRTEASTLTPPRSSQTLFSQPAVTFLPLIPFLEKSEIFFCNFPLNWLFPSAEQTTYGWPRRKLLPWARAGSGGTWRGPPGMTLRPSMLQQLLLSKLHPMTLDLWGDAHGETRVPILSPSPEKTPSSPLQEKRRKRPNHPSAPA